MNPEQIEGNLKVSCKVDLKTKERESGERVTKLNLLKNQGVWTSQNQKDPL
jgi:hypothetical protein